MAHSQRPEIGAIILEQPYGLKIPVRLKGEQYLSPMVYQWRRATHNDLFSEQLRLWLCNIARGYFYSDSHYQLIDCALCTREAVSIESVMTHEPFGRPFYSAIKYRMFEISYVAILAAIAIANEIQNSS